ncbi:beta-ketoacyl synthase N-terminal-like domain-containing protein [Streptomyces sp. B6B3]|uniref:beta-ketoacyl synthase N-terminal-like domain-containing protein n=1 Tax=Streptomyces sp. B6B3 TaxID=3153570 RepID=UPI00325F8AA3
MEDAIAIIGAGCRMPSSPSLAAFWRNLRTGTDMLSRFGPGELRAVGVPDGLLRHPEFVPVRGVVPGGEAFDWDHFGYSPGEARTIDPQQRVFLEVCLAALQDAGVRPANHPGWIGVFAGCDSPLSAFDAAEDTSLLNRVLGTDKDFLATRVAYKLGLRGPAITVQTACSTSLVATHQACQSLRNYECDVALAGGSTLVLPQPGGYVFAEGHVMSRDGRCRSYDADSTGTVPSHGSGAVVLRRLADALADGDRIMAVLRGSAVNNDGKDKIGYTAPSLTGQRDVIRLALGQAEVDPADLTYVEGHGTATQLGDPVEVAALTAAFRSATDRVGYCWLGSVKSNIGHTSAAAGVAGLIKTALMLEHRELVPTLHFSRPNPKLELETSPFRVITETRPLPDDRPALAGVSSFGIGGTNAHAVLESPPRPVSGSGPRVFCLSAPSGGALRRARAELADRIDPAGEGAAAPDPVAAAWTLVHGRTAQPHRVSVVAEDLDAAAAELRDEAGRPGTHVRADVRAAFVFPGHGALYPGAAAAAYAELPVFRELFDEAMGRARSAWDVDLSVALRPDADEAAARDSMVQQIALFALSYGLGQQLLAWGVRPTALLGQSLGEYAAAALAGVWDLRAGLELVAARARAIERIPPGRMLAVYAEHADVADLLAGSDIAVATEGPGQLVLSGSADAIERLTGDLTRRSLDSTLLRAPAAGHTEQMRPVGDALRTALARVPSGVAELPVVSNLTGDLVDPERLRDPDYWSDQMCHTVRLASGMGALLATGCDVVVEVGPGQLLTGGLRRHPDWTDAHVGIPLLGRSAEPRRGTLFDGLGRLWAAGLPVDWEPLFTERPTTCSLPPVPLDSRPLPTRPARPAPRDVPAGMVVYGETAARAAELAEELIAAGTRVTAALSAHAPDPEPAAPAVANALTWPADDRPRIADRPDLTDALDAYAAGLAGRFVRDATGLGANGDHATSRSDLAAALDPERRLPALAGYLVTLLVEQGWLTGPDERLTAVDDLDERVRAALGRAAELGELAGVRRLLEHCVAGYPDVFAGRVPPADLLRGGDTPPRAHLADNEVAFGDTATCLAALPGALTAWRASRAGRADRTGQPDGPFRVLEVGAGHGELTWRLAPALAGTGPLTYDATDADPARVTALREEAERRGETSVRIRAFDLTADPASVGLVPGSYDLVVACDTVHLAPSAPAVLRNLGRLVRRDGVLCLVEPVATDRWAPLVWGLAGPGGEPADPDGDPDEGARRPGPPDAAGWTKAFAEAGFACVAASPAERAAAAVLVAGLADPDRFRDPQHELARQTVTIQFQPATPPTGTPTGVTAPSPAAEPRPPTTLARQGAAGQLAELWRRTLGVSAAHPDDDFFRLGGESLALVQLLGKVRELTGVRVALADLVASPTLATLTHLALPTGAEPENDSRTGPDAGGDPSPGPAGETSARGDVTAPDTGPHGPAGPVPGTGVGPGGNAGAAPGAEPAPRTGPTAGLARRAEPGTEGRSATRPARGLLPLHLPAQAGARLPAQANPRPPLFLAAPGTGTSLCYRNLAPLLGADQPVYGLEAAGLHDDAEPFDRFEAAARHNLALLRSVQPHGPYRLGGWSLGAMVAHEMARQLLARGERVEPLLFVDGFLPYTWGLPLGVRPALLAGTLMSRAQTALPFLRPRHVAAGLELAGVRPENADPAGGPLAHLGEEYVRVYHANVRALLRYVPRPVDCGAVVFKAGLTPRSRRRLLRSAAPLYRDGVRAVAVPGDHWSVLDPRFVGALADRMRAALESRP